MTIYVDEIVYIHCHQQRKLWNMTLTIYICVFEAVVMTSDVETLTAVILSMMYSFLSVTVTS